MNRSLRQRVLTIYTHNPFHYKTGMKIMLIFLSSLLVLCIPMLDKTWTEKAFLSLSWPALLTLSLLFIYSLSKLLSASAFSFRCFIKKSSPCLLICLALTFFVFKSVEVKFKTLSDETNLLAKSRTLAFEKKPLNMTEAKNYFESTHPLNYELPKRPLLFPFAASILHNLLGYHPSNVFILNFLTLFAFLSLMTLSGSLFLPAAAALSIPLWVLSQPILSIFACSGGFDLFSMAFFFISMGLLFLFLNKPDPLHWECLWLALILYAHTRYESILLTVLILPILLGWKFIPFSLLKSSISLPLTPFLIAPLIWQRMLRTDVYENPEGIPLFSTDHFFTHLKEFILSQSLFDFTLPYNPFLFYIGIILLPLFFCKRHAFSGPAKRFLLLFAIFFFFLYTLYLSHFFGHYSHPSSARFFLIYAATAALAPFCLFIFYPRIPSLLFPALGVIFFLLYHPVAINDSFTNSLTLNRKTDYAYAFLHKFPSDTLIIVDRPGQYTVMNYGAVSFDYANSHSEELLRELKANLYPDILVIQEISRNTGKPLQDQKLDKVFPLRLLDKKMTCAETVVRIAKVDKKRL